MATVTPGPLTGFPMLYRIKPGDTLTKIIATEYGANRKYQNEIIKQIQTDNPEITDPNIIKGDQLILLNQYSHNNPFANMPASSDINIAKANWTTTSLPTKNAMVEISPIYNYLNLGSLGVGANLAAVTSLFKSNTYILNDIPQAYTDYKAGKITKGQYDYLRKQRLDKFKKHLGPIQKLLYGNKTPHEVFRISQKKSIEATKKMTQNIKNLSRVADIASKGGLVLTAAGIASSCHQIANTPDRVQKNIIAVESTVSTIIGTGTGFVLGIFLITTPLGWGAALAIGVGSSALSYFSGRTAGKLYDKHLKSYDIVDTLSIDKVCS